MDDESENLRSGWVIEGRLAIRFCCTIVCFLLRLAKPGKGRYDLLENMENSRLVAYFTSG